MGGESGGTVDMEGKWEKSPVKLTHDKMPGKIAQIK